MEFEPVSARVCELGEGVVWDSARQRLGYVDMLRGRLTVIDAEGEESRNVVPGTLTAISPHADSRAWLAAVDASIGFLDEFAFEERVQVPVLPGTRLNDGACDSAGRFWVGSIHELEPGRGLLFRVDPDWTVHLMAQDLTLTNGIGWSPDDATLYVIDTIPGILWAWAFDAQTGGISGRRALITEMGTGIPDGLAVDVEGNIWVAFVFSGALRVFSASGDLLEDWKLPVSRATCPEFVNEHGSIYVSTATLGADDTELEREPWAGRLLRARVPVSGLPVHVARHALG